MPNTYSRHIHVLKALSDETRLKIVHMLTCKKMCANDLLECFHITQPTLSYHMKILQEANIVQCTRNASYAIYSVDPHVIGRITELLCMLQEGETGDGAEEKVANAPY